MNISEALKETIGNFKKAGIESPELDAHILLAHVLNTEKFKLITDNQKELSKNNIEKLNALVKKRIKGEPIAYLTFKKEFYSIDFTITKDVLIPRPETEHLVDLAIFHAKQNGSILDIGTGSGAIAIALKKNRPDLFVYACDISNMALKIAQKNAKKILGENSIIFSKSDLFQTYTGKKFDLILSNPPYLSRYQKHTMQKEVLFEPESALFADSHGIEIIKRIVSEAKKYLYSYGLLLIEIGFDQENYIRKIGTKDKYLVTILKDYANLPRTAVLKKNE